MALIPLLCARQFFDLLREKTSGRSQNKVHAGQIGRGAFDTVLFRSHSPATNL